MAGAQSLLGSPLLIYEGTITIAHYTTSGSSYGAATVFQPFGSFSTLYSLLGGASGGADPKFIGYNVGSGYGVSPATNVNGAGAGSFDFLGAPAVITLVLNGVSATLAINVAGSYFINGDPLNFTGQNGNTVPFQVFM